MKGGSIEKGYLTDADKAIKWSVKRWLYLARSASADLVFLIPTPDGGGLLPLGDSYDLLTIPRVYKIIKLSNKSTKEDYVEEDQSTSHEHGYGSIPL